jgi:integrase/recombinase XerD
VDADFSISTIRSERYPQVSVDLYGRGWLDFQANRGLAPNTLDAYGRNLDAYLRFLGVKSATAKDARRSDVASYVRELTSRTLGSGQASADGTRPTLAHATIQQHLTVIRLFYDYLVEEQICTRNPLRPGSGLGFGRRGLIQTHRRLPWIPGDEEWQRILNAAKVERLRNRVMLTLSYDSALRREELCALQSGDVDPSLRLLRIRAETTKNRRERVVPFSEDTAQLFARYLDHRRGLSRARGPLFLSESRRNRSHPISIWTWSKAIIGLARRCNLPRLTPHTLRHLCLTDLARANWDIGDIAAFAGHCSTQTTMLYVHLSGRDLAAKLARGMSEIHAYRVALMKEILR